MAPSATGLDRSMAEHHRRAVYWELLRERWLRLNGRTDDADFAAALAEQHRRDAVQAVIDAGPRGGAA